MVKHLDEFVGNRSQREEEEWSNKIAKSNLLLLTHSRETCSRCPICSYLTLARKEALLHLNTAHPETEATQTKVPRIHLHQWKTHANCKINDSSNLINLKSLNELCESWLLDLVHANEIEGPNVKDQITFGTTMTSTYTPHFAITLIVWTPK